MYFPFFFDWTYLILIPGLILSAWAQHQVSKNFRTYSRVPTKSGLTGAEAARKLLDINNLQNVKIEGVAGSLTDHYDPRGKLMRLSNDVGNAATVAGVGVAAHETGHAIQDKENYFPLRFRNFIVPISSFASKAAWPLFFIGLIIGGSASTGIGPILMDLGIILFCLSIVFYVITLPVEFNASARAIKTLEEYQLLAPEEIPGVKKVLRAAALTYVASALMAFLNLFRLLAIRNRN